MEALLFNLIEKSKNDDKEALLEIIYNFKPTIKKFSNQLSYDGAETDLIISLIELVKEINLNKLNMKNDGIMVNLIYNSLKNKTIDLFRKNILRNKVEYGIDLDMIEDESKKDMEVNIFIHDALNILSSLQRDIVIEKYFKGYSDSEIANRFNISRQAVNRLKNRALENLSQLIAS